MTTTIELPRRATRADTPTDRRRVWTDRTGRYRLAEYRSLYERDRRGRPRVRWTVETRDAFGWLPQSTHRSRHAALAALERLID